MDSARGVCSDKRRNETSHSVIEPENSLSERMLLAKINASFIGSNVGGKKPELLFYAGGVPAFRTKLAEVEANDYDSFEMH